MDSKNTSILDEFIARVRAGEQNPHLPYTPQAHILIQRIHGVMRNPKGESLIRRGLWLCAQCAGEKIDSENRHIQIQCDEGHLMHFQGPVDILESEIFA
jgi:hypothetical protein